MKPYYDDLLSSDIPPEQALEMAKLNYNLEHLMEFSDKSEFTQKDLWLLLRSCLSDQASQTRSGRALLLEGLQILKSQVAAVDQVMNACEQQGAATAKNRVLAFSSIIAGQFMLFQYGTYVAYSWDIIEPIACVTGFLDAFFASVFYVRFNGDWNVAGINKYYTNKYKTKKVRKENIDMERYEELKDAILKIEERLK
jgi:hypothetical protein